MEDYVIITVGEKCMILTKKEQSLGFEEDNEIALGDRKSEVQK
jgi:hypothetical protein